MKKGFALLGTETTDHGLEQRPLFKLVAFGSKVTLISGFVEAARRCSLRCQSLDVEF